jgi:hypothetical protein
LLAVADAVRARPRRPGGAGGRCWLRRSGWLCSAAHRRPAGRFANGQRAPPAGAPSAVPAVNRSALTKEPAMESKEVNVQKFVGRHLSQLKILSRLLEHELETAKGAREVTMDRHLIENILDTLEIFTDDVETVSGGLRERNRAEQKPVVARLN